METKISAWWFIPAVLGTLIVVGVGYSGIVATARFFLASVASLVYCALVVVAIVAVAASVFGAVTSVLAELDAHQDAPRFNLFGESVVLSVVFVLLGIFVGNIAAFVAHQIDAGAIFPFAEAFVADSLFAVLWKPYLSSYIVSLFLGALVYGERKWRFRKKK